MSPLTHTFEHLVPVDITVSAKLWKLEWTELQEKVGYLDGDLEILGPVLS